MNEIDLYVLKLKILEIDKNIEVVRKEDLDVPIFNYRVSPGPNFPSRLEQTSSIGPNVYRINKIKLELNKLGKKELIINNENDIILLPNISQYHHMLFEVIGRILYLSQYSQNNKYDVLIISDKKINYDNETITEYSAIVKLLKMLGINFFDKAINLEEYKTIEVKNVLITEYENSVMFDKYGEVAKIIRNKFKTNGSPTNNFYISRKHVSKNSLRKVLNEELIENFYKKKNYEIVYLEYLSIKDQIDLFANAKNVVGLTGTGLSNVIFAHKDAKFLEIRNYSGYYNNDHQRAASFCDIDYNILITQDTQDANIIIPKLEKYYEVNK